MRGSEFGGVVALGCISLVRGESWWGKLLGAGFCTTYEVY
jgi:hypothetical protein